MNQFTGTLLIMYGVNLSQGKLLKDIEETFGNFFAFEQQFTQLATTLFGSGYVWLCMDKEGALEIVPTHNQVGVVSASTATQL